MSYAHLAVETEDLFTVVRLEHGAKRNPLSMALMAELLDAFGRIGDSKTRGVLLESSGAAFCSGHDFRDMVGRDLAGMRELLARCVSLMTRVQEIPQPVVAAVQGIAAGGGCQLVAACDLAVAAKSATFVTPGGKGGWFWTTPMVSVSRAIGRKRALEMLLCGDAIDADTAAEWGLVNRVVPDSGLAAASRELLRRATRGSAFSKGIGKQAYYAQIDMDQPKAYAYALEVMASSALTDDAQENMRAFVEKRRPVFKN
jgi:enoyl-CoA hydratase/carnithine racemase